MKINNTILSAMLGTSAMTMYSYIQSSEEEKDFREPKLLNSLIENLSLEKRVPKATGWLLHYAVGLVFAPAYHLIWDNTGQSGIVSGALMGAVNGAIGVGIWSAVLNNHPSPPGIDRKAFYRHLIFAHMVYGAFNAPGYEASKNNVL